MTKELWELKPLQWRKQLVNGVWMWHANCCMGTLTVAKWANDRYTVTGTDGYCNSLEAAKTQANKTLRKMILRSFKQVL